MPEKFAKNIQPGGFGRDRKLANSINWHKSADRLHCPWCAARGVVKDGMTLCPECQRPIKINSKVVTMYRAERE